MNHHDHHDHHDLSTMTMDTRGADTLLFRTYCPRICDDLRTAILTYLTTREYGILRSLSRGLAGDQDPLLEQCLTTYRLHGLVSCERILMHRIPVRHLQTLYVECKNTAIPIAPIVLPSVRTVGFYATYSLYTMFFEWEQFFERVKCPSLERIDWQNVSFSFADMRRIFHKYGIGENVRHLQFSASPFHRSPVLDEDMTITEESIEFYKACPKLEYLRLDAETKSMDACYVQLFRPVSTPFISLRELQLVNRSKSVIDLLCENEAWLPHLERLAILWLFDPNPFFHVPSIEEELQRQEIPSSPSPYVHLRPSHTYKHHPIVFPLTIRKPSLRSLRLCFHEWQYSTDTLPMRCELWMETNQSVAVRLEHVSVHVRYTSHPLIS